MSDPPHVLVVDDQLAMAETLADALTDAGLRATALSSPRQAATLLEPNGQIDVLLTDLRMPELDGLQLLAHSKRVDPARPVIVMTAYGAIDSAIEAIRRGAFHYLAKPFKNEELVLFVRRAIEQAALTREAEDLRRAVHRERSGLVAESRAMRQVVETVRRVADVEMPVLLLGETGTGKGRVASLLHESGRRAKAPFVTLNCAAIPEALLESELFGHVRGAFTGATTDRAGLLVEAHGGTLFLDEIGDLALPLQAKLLHVLERGLVRPVGGTKERAIDVRIVAATHRDLRERARTGTFREDLLYRLDVVSIEIPPLRQRREDIPVLIEHFFSQARARHDQASARRLSAAALAALLDHAWPGNVRELAHTLERAVVLARGTTIELEDLPAAVRAPERASPLAFRGDVVTMREAQRRYAQWVLDRLGGHRGRTAETLDIDPKTLSRLLNELD